MTPSPIDILRTLAAAEGCSHFGIASPAPFATEFDFFRNWLQEGRNGAMKWLEHSGSLRQKPGDLLPGVRSIAVFAFPYFHEPARSEAPRISAYALGADYHRVIRQRLTRILSSLRRHFPAINGLVTVDSAPVFEKALAVRAGLGWIGHNTCLIHPICGSYVFLGELFLDLPLPHSEPRHGSCGGCDRCLAACPTGALIAPGILDSRRCIAYQTIEYRGIFDPASAGKLNGWLFGCDICQSVCPHNRNAPAGLPEFQADSRITRVDPRQLLEMSGKSFRRIFGFSSLARATHSGLLRTLIALAPSLPLPLPETAVRMACARYPLVRRQQGTLSAATGSGLEAQA